MQKYLVNSKKSSTFARFFARLRIAYAAQEALLITFIIN